MLSVKQATDILQLDTGKVALRKASSLNEARRDALRNIQNHKASGKLLKKYKSNFIQPSKENIKCVRLNLSPKTKAKVNFFNSKNAGSKHSEVNSKSKAGSKNSIVTVVSNFSKFISVRPVKSERNKIFPKNVSIPKIIPSVDRQVFDPLRYNEYMPEVLQHLKNQETQYIIRNDFLSDQSETDGQMRADLVDWIHRNASRFEVYEETFYLTVALIDLYLQNVDIPARSLPLLGIAALLVACKYEEISTPSLEEFVKISQFRNSKQDILAMECSLLNVLNFRVGRPVPIQFLRRYSEVNKCGKLSHNLAKFFLELSLLNHNLASVSPSLLAAAASCLSLWVLADLPWTPEMEYHSGYTAGDVAPVTKTLANFVENYQHLKNEAVMKKFSGDKYMQVACLPQLSAIVKCFP